MGAAVLSKNILSKYGLAAAGAMASLLLAAGPLHAQPAPPPSPQPNPVRTVQQVIDAFKPTIIDQADSLNAVTAELKKPMQNA